MSDTIKEAVKKYTRLAGVVVSSWALLGIIWVVAGWSFQIRADIDGNSSNVKTNKEEIRNLHEIADSLTKLHERQQTENDLIKALCRTKQASEAFCMSKGFPYGS